MKGTILTVIIILSNQVFGGSLLFDTLKITSTTKIIGMNAIYDNSGMFENFNFIIEDSLAIDKFIKALKVGEEIPNSSSYYNFTLNIIKDNEKIGAWTVNPNEGSVMTHDGHTYKFNFNQLYKYSKRYPLYCKLEKKTFISKSEYEIYLGQQQLNPNFLFRYAPQFKYEGNFKIKFIKSEQFSDPRAISNYLNPIITKIVNEMDYTLSYALDENNMSDTSQFTMTITGSMKLFDELKRLNFKAENWQLTIEEGYFFYKE